MKHDQLPLVSIVALCYNHGLFVEEALASILIQDYPSVQVIVVNDASNDDSKDKIDKIAHNNPDWKVIHLDRNIGNCKAFNLALTHVTGKYIIDFATDDVLVSDRIIKQVIHFESLPEDVGMVYSNACLINEEDAIIKERYNKTMPPQGSIFKEILSDHFICPPSVMFKTEVLKSLGGYDETLSYEDFDIWLRIARQYKIAFLDEILVKKRILKNSLSVKIKTKSNEYTDFSTLRILQKTKLILQNKSEKKAFLKRIRIEIRQAIRVGNIAVLSHYLLLYKSLSTGVLYWLYKCLFVIYLKERNPIDSGS